MSDRVRVLAIRLQEYNQGWKGWYPRPFLFHVDEDGHPLWHPDRRFYHGVNGPTWQPLDSEHTNVEKDYGTFVYDDYDALDEVEIQFSQDWPPDKVGFGDEIPESPLLGFIAPNGAFYPCRYDAHIGLGKWIHRAIMRELGDDQKLLAAGWVQVNRGAIDLPDIVTERQKTILYELYTRSDETGSVLSRKDIPFKRTMRWALEELGMLESSVKPLRNSPQRVV